MHLNNETNIDVVKYQSELVILFFIQFLAQTTTDCTGSSRPPYTSSILISGFRCTPKFFDLLRYLNLPTLLTFAFQPVFIAASPNTIYTQFAIISHWK